MKETTVQRIPVQAAQQLKQPKKLSPKLRFTPYAWAKLLYLRDLNNAEVGGFALTEPDDLLLVIDIVLVKQVVSSVTFAFDDAAVADFFDSQVEAGRQPEQFARIWIHTHPGNMPHPSSIDEQTFERIFGKCHWAVMFIIDQEGQTYARIRFNIGPGAQGELPVEVDYSCEFPCSDKPTWLDEYKLNVRHEYCPMEMQHGRTLYGNYYGTYEELMAEIEHLDPDDREFILAQLKDDFQEIEEEVMEE